MNPDPQPLSKYSQPTSMCSTHNIAVVIKNLRTKIEKNSPSDPNAYIALMKKFAKKKSEIRQKNSPSDPKAYITALKKFAKRGDICSVFTPDDTHFEIIEAALDHGLHVMLAPKWAC
jgi:hypothetical protein